MAPPYDYPNQTPPQGQQDPFLDWYRNTIQANPNRFDPAHFSEGQARAWFPLWDANSNAFRSSKTMYGKPIEGNQFEHPDECPPGTQAFGQNECRPVGEIPGQGGGGMGGGMGGGQFFSGGYRPPYAANYNFPDLPKFQMPTAEGMLSDPGYKFRLKQGLGALESSAAAKGVLNTGGTLQDINKFGQDYASNEFGNIWQRAKDQYAPYLAQYQNQFGQTAAERQRAWENYQFSLNDEFRRQQMLLGAQPPGMSY